MDPVSVPQRPPARKPDTSNREQWPEPVPVTCLKSDTHGTDWLWAGCLARRHLTLFSALSKSGKSTVLAHLLKAVQCGSPFFGRGTRKCRTLVVSEESREKWIERRESLELDESLSLLCRPTRAKLSPREWEGFIEHLLRLSVGAFDVIVFDTISCFAPWRDENASAEVEAAVRPLNRLLEEADAAVMLVHHFGKAGGSEGRAARGSTALTAAADILLELRRLNPKDTSDRRRLLSGYGRFDEIPEQVVVALAPDGSGYLAEGDRVEVAGRELRALISETLPASPPGCTADELHVKMAPNTRPRRGDVMKALQAGANSGAWSRAGTGKKGDPFRFWMGERDSDQPFHCVPGTRNAIGVS